MFENEADFDDFGELVIPGKRSSRGPCETPHKRQRMSETNSPVCKVGLRRFPGPAGLLLPSDGSRRDDVVVCSQMSLDAFGSRSWELVCHDFPSLTAKYNISWIKLAAKQNRLINQRAPFLAGIVETIRFSKAKSGGVFDFCLKDPTGKITGTLHASSEDEKLLKTGTVLVLKQFGVLLNENDSIHITTTGNSLMSVYSQEGVIVKQPLFVPDFMEELREIELKHKLGAMVETPAKKMPDLGQRQKFSFSNLNLTSLSTNNLSSTSLNRTSSTAGLNTASLNSPRLNTTRNAASLSSLNAAGLSTTKHANRTVLNTSSPNSAGLNVTSPPDLSKARRKFTFRKTESGISLNKTSSNQIETGWDKEVESIFEGIDTDALFDEF